MINDKEGTKRTVYLGLFGSTFIQAIHTSFQALKISLLAMSGPNFKTHYSVQNGIVDWHLSFISQSVKDKNRLIRNTFNDIVRELIDLIDLRLAMDDMSNHKTNIAEKDAPKKDEDVNDYIIRFLYQRANMKGQDITLKNPKKISLIPNLSDDSAGAILGYLKIRNSIEHHKSIANTDIPFKIIDPNLFFSSGSIITAPESIPRPLKWDKGVVSRIIKKDDVIIITMKELESFVFTIQTTIAEEILV